MITHEVAYMGRRLNTKGLRHHFTDGNGTELIFKVAPPFAAIGDWFAIEESDGGGFAVRGAKLLERPFHGSRAAWSLEDREAYLAQQAAATRKRIAKEAKTDFGSLTLDELRQHVKWAQNPGAAMAAVLDYLR